MARDHVRQRGNQKGGRSEEITILEVYWTTDTVQTTTYWGTSTAVGQGFAETPCKEDLSLLTVFLTGHCTLKGRKPIQTWDCRRRIF